MTACPPKRAYNPGWSRGGKTAAARLTAAQRSERAAKAGNAVLRHYGIEYFSSLGKMSQRKRNG